MSVRRNFQTRPEKEKGAIAVLVGVMLIMLLGFGALALDIGYMMVTRNELQNTADGAALGAARRLGRIYQGLSYDAQQSYSAAGDLPAIISVAQDVGEANAAAGRAVTVLDSDVVLGRWSKNSDPPFTPTNAQPDAVRVVTRRDATANGPATTFLARVLGIQSFSANAEAVAALTGQSTVNEGDLELPVGVSRAFFDNRSEQDFCDEDVKFYPTNDPDSCAGWTSYDLNANDITLRRILDEVGGFENPETIAGETAYNFTGGTMSNPTFDALLSLFQRKGYDVNEDWSYILVNGSPVHQATVAQGARPLLDSDGIQLEYPDGTLRNKHKWETSVAIYDRDDCTNPNRAIKIVGFAQVEVRDVLNSPDKLVRARIKCDYVGPQDNRGGGAEYGMKGSIPGLVR
ncbi:MAG: hypothetical protein HY900_10275 [Deltaproteobacteria bacterium]|nr:hypothetical protein [Deltaproteobacteria bacterium]